MIDLTTDLAPLATQPARQRLRALQRILPRAQVQAVLQQTGHDQAYCRRLPAAFMVWFVVGLGLFCRDSYRQVFRWLCPFRTAGTPGRSTLCMARQRLGVAPLFHLAQQAVGLLATPDTPGAFWRGYRLMGVDGFVVDVPDSADNARIFGRPKGGRSAGAFPQVRTVALCELGTHVLWRWLCKPIPTGEGPMARTLCRWLGRKMLLLGDRPFGNFPTLRAIRRQGAQALLRLKNNQKFLPLRYLEDGSYLSKIYPCAADRAKDRHGVWVRVLEYTFTDPGRPGSGQRHRLLTTLLNARHFPGRELIALYHQRWEEELAIDELKTHQRERLTLRSATPGGVVQELYGLLLGHYAVRTLMAEAAALRGVAPLRISFVETLKIVRCRLPECPKSAGQLPRWYRQLVQEVSHEVLPVRRRRLNPRVIKRKMSKWPKKRPEHRSPPQPQMEFHQGIVMLH
jgi:Insertion element 4 transposase N-terminal/Transposase DDE domain